MDDFETRLQEWKSFRDYLETVDSPVQVTVDFWNKAPFATRSLDPYDSLTWPDPWEMIEENSYCEFTRLLAVAYTLTMTKSFKDCQPIFKIAIDRAHSNLYYILTIENNIICIDNDNSMYCIDSLPHNLQIQKIHVLKKCY